MALLDELHQLPKAPRPHGGVKCRIATVLDSVQPEEADALRHLIDYSDVYGSSIAKTLAAHGFQINAGQVGHHRRRVRGGGCSCPLPDEAA